MTNLHALYPSDQLTLREVGLRDDLQLVKAWPSTGAKQDWIRREYAGGVRHFEVGSFLPAARMPQFADVRELIETVAALDGAFSSALMLNERGAADALETPVDELVCVVSASDEHSRANIRRSQAESVELVSKIAELRNAAANKPVIMAGIAMAFGCSIAGAMAPREVLRLAEKCLKAGADVIGVADTVGFVGPDEVAEMSGRLKRLCGDQPLNVHLHDTRGLGLANASAAIDHGARIIDASLGGSAAVPLRPAQQATSYSRIWFFSARRRASIQASISTRSQWYARYQNGRCRRSTSMEL